VLDFTDAAREIALINGTPAHLLRSADQIDEIMAHQAEEAQAQQVVSGAPQVSMAAKNLGQAQLAIAQAGQASSGT
jgi:hypothetical protein